MCIYKEGNTVLTGINSGALTHSEGFHVGFFFNVTIYLYCRSKERSLEIYLLYLIRATWCILTHSSYSHCYRSRHLGSECTYIHEPIASAYIVNIPSTHKCFLVAFSVIVFTVVTINTSSHLIIPAILNTHTYTEVKNPIIFILMDPHHVWFVL